MRLKFLVFCATTFLVTSLTGTENEINAKTAGAVGDGSNDDSTALQMAIDKACAGKNPTRTVKLPPGKYRVTKTLKLENKHRNISIIGTGGARPGSSGKHATTEIIFDGQKGGTLFECKPLSGLRLTDLYLNGNNKAGTLLRVNSTPGHGTAEFFIERVCLSNADTGIECGADLEVCASDMTFIDLTIDNMKKAGFRAVSGQALDYVFIRPEVGHTPIGFHFIKGGAATFIHPCAFKVDTLLKVEKTGINSGVFSIRGWFWERHAYSDPNKKMVFVDASGEANITVIGTATGCSRVWGEKADLETPNFILGPSAQLTAIGCMISGKIAKLTGEKDNVATFIQFNNCRFRCAANPKENIECDEYSGYEFKNCNVTIDETKSKKYKIIKKIFIPQLVKYPRQAKGEPGCNED